MSPAFQELGPLDTSSSRVQRPACSLPAAQPWLYGTRKWDESGATCGWPSVPSAVQKPPSGRLKDPKSFKEKEPKKELNIPNYDKFMINYKLIMLSSSWSVFVSKSLCHRLFSTSSVSPEAKGETRREAPRGPRRGRTPPALRLAPANPSTSPPPRSPQVQKANTSQVIRRSKLS